jgi:hypothetical protein
VADYVPGTLETDPKKLVMSLQQLARTLSGKITAPTSTTDNAAARYDGTTGALQNSALLVADTTGSLSRSGNGGIPLQGTNTNDSASAGYVGELIESDLTSGSAVSMTSGVDQNITSISLTAGDWDVWGVLLNIPASGSILSQFIGWVSTTSATNPATANGGAINRRAFVWPADAVEYLPVGMRRISVGSTTTVYLGCRVVMSTAGQSVYGYIGARRVR